MSEQGAEQAKKVRKPKSQTQYVLLGVDGDGATVLFSGKAKSEIAVWDMVEGMNLAEGEHRLMLASVRGERIVEVATKRVVTTKKG
jgi:hypothetical protein